MVRAKNIARKAGQELRIHSSRRQQSQSSKLPERKQQSLYSRRLQSMHPKIQKRCFDVIFKDGKDTNKGRRTGC
jgi:hypothetical protein